ncbi:MAG: hypothetical protein MUO68_07035 [Desulfobacteraceae bacterium]|nr:hypothetical protein [Desulfobacteraceae bacterium]
MRAKGFFSKTSKGLVTKQSEPVKHHAKETVERSGRPYVHLKRSIRNEDKARQIAHRDGIIVKVLYACSLL